MITFTESAKQKVLSFLPKDASDPQAVRVAVMGRGPFGFEYQFFLDAEKNKRPEDQMLDLGTFRVLVDSASAKNLNGAVVDWVESVDGAGFKVENPNEPKPDLTSPLAKKVQDLLDHEINPGVASHGGRVTLVDVKDDRVFIHMGGGCHGCGMANATLKQGIEARIKEVIPQVKEVVDTTDHASGENPYYA